MPDGVFTYEKRGKPAFGVRVHYKGDDGTWRPKEWRGFTTQRDALKFLNAKREARYQEKFFSGSGTPSCSVQTYFDRWLEDYASQHCKFSTFHSYALLLTKYLYPSLGPIPLAALTPVHLKQLLTSLAGKQRQTIKNIFTPIREGLSHAVAEGLIPSNPVSGLAVQFKQTKATAFTPKPLTRTQETELLKAAQAIHAMLYISCILGVKCGLRRGEILGIRWEDIDWKKRVASIQHTLVRGKPTTAKNHRMRRVDLPPSAMKVLQHYRKPSGRIVPMSAAWLNQAFARIAPTIRLHDLRHTYASRLIDLGANPKYIQRQLGHSSIAVTFDVYGTLMSGKRWVDKIG